MSGWTGGASASHALNLALAEGREHLAGIEGAAQDARVLLAHAAGLNRDQLHRLELADFTPALRASYLALLARRAGGEPVSKILGYRDFWRYRFEVTKEVLDPRPETEVLVAKALSEPFERVLDLGTGSGAILLTLLAERPQAKGQGVDLSEAALAVAARNADTLGVAARLTLTRSDWFAQVEGRFDLLVSNPPYIALDEMPGLSREVSLHDPRLALTDEGDGLTAYRAIAAGAGAHLAPGGRLLLEIGPTQAEAVSKLLENEGFIAIEVLKDLDGRDRTIAARWPDPSR